MSDNESGFSFVWKIENFSMLHRQLDENFESPKFVVDVWEKVEFWLCLYPRASHPNEGYLSLFLYKTPMDLDLKVNFNLAIESTEPSEEILLPIKDFVLKSSGGFLNFMSLDDIFVKTNLYLPQDTLTIRCELWPAEEPSTKLYLNQDTKTTSMFIRQHCVSRTCIQVQRRFIMWSIGNAKELVLQRRENPSILLSTTLKNSPKLKLTLDLNKIATGDDIPISIQQTDLLSENQQIFVKCKITVMTSREEYQTSKTSSHLFQLNTSDVWSFPSLIRPSMLMDDKYLKVSDTLFLRCEFAFSYKNGVHHLENSYLVSSSVTIPKNSELSTCFENIFGCEKFCDIQLKAGGRTFPYYKAVLCARSSVFSAMFENNMEENNSNVVEIEDVDPDTLHRMLTYMHSDILPEDLSPEDVCSLYRVADKYDLKSLKNKCSVLLATTMTMMNVCDLMFLADAHLDNFLMTAVTDFICIHNIEVFHSAQWKTFMEAHQTLACEVMHRMLTGKFQF